MYYPYTAGVAALSHFYFNPLYFQALEKRMAKKCAKDEDVCKSLRQPETPYPNLPFKETPMISARNQLPATVKNVKKAR